MNLYKDIEKEQLQMLPWKSYDKNVYYEMQSRIDMQKLKPFFIVEHYPYTVSLLLKINTNYKADVFHKAGLQGSSKDWERLSTILMDDYYMNNSGIDLFEFDSDDDIFCIFPNILMPYSDLLYVIYCLRAMMMT